MIFLPGLVWQLSANYRSSAVLRPRLLFSRWTTYFNLWAAFLFLSGALACFLLGGPFAWNGLFDFWLASGAFFAWPLVMTQVLLKAISTSPAEV